MDDLQLRNGKSCDQGWIRLGVAKRRGLDMSQDGRFDVCGIVDEWDCSWCCIYFRHNLYQMVFFDRLKVSLHSQ